MLFMSVKKLRLLLLSRHASQMRKVCGHGIEYTQQKCICNLDILLVI